METNILGQHFYICLFWIRNSFKRAHNTEHFW